MNTPEEFIEANEDNKEQRTVNLTPQQIEIIESLALVNGQTFEDVAMVLFQVSFTKMGDDLYKKLIEPLVRKN